MRRLLITTLAVTGLLALSPASQAQIIGFDQEGDAGGTISWDGNIGTSVVGADITFGSITAPGFDITCSSCVMTFTSGAATSTLDQFPEGIASFGAGGTLTIVGGVPAAGIADGTVLVSGEFSQGSVNDNGDGTFTFSGSGTDTKNAVLLAYLGINAEDFTYATTDIAFDCDNGTCQVFNADFNNTAVPVPEPPVVGLLGLGLLGVYWQSRKRARG